MNDIALVVGVCLCVSFFESQICCELEALHVSISSNIISDVSQFYAFGLPRKSSAEVIRNANSVVSFCV